MILLLGLKKYPHINFILNGGIDSLEKAKDLSNTFDGVMLGRLIQNNPFELSKVDNYFFEEKNIIKSNEDIISSYFQYIGPKIKIDSIFRLLSPLLSIFFGVPNSKSLKNEVNECIKNGNLELIESIFLSFVKEKRLL